MIELPDVERMIERIAGYTTGKTVSQVLIDDPSVAPIPETIAEELLARHAIDSVERHGRYAVLRFRSGHSLLFDLGDDGQLRLESQTQPATDRTRVRLQFAAGRELRFSSNSGTTCVEAVPAEEFDESGGLRRLGIDPLSDELTRERFESLARQHSRATLKGFLLNPKAIAGIGNDYADEICFQAGVRPDLRVSQLNSRRLGLLHRYLKRILQRATLHWTAAHADPGWLINSRASGSPCPRCRNELQVLKMVGRETVICPRCQRAA